MKIIVINKNFKFLIIKGHEPEYRLYNFLRSIEQILNQPNLLQLEGYIIIVRKKKEQPYSSNIYFYTFIVSTLQWFYTLWNVIRSKMKFKTLILVTPNIMHNPSIKFQERFRRSHWRMYSALNTFEISKKRTFWNICFLSK